MEERRKIIINPDLFKVNSSGGTRKKKDSGNGNNKIKMKKPVSMDNKNKKSIKNKILRYIREQQEQKYKSLYEDNFSKHTAKKNIEPILNELDTISAIEDTIQHFDALEKQLKTKDEVAKTTSNAHNRTLRNNIITDSNLYNSYMGVSTPKPPNISLPNVTNQIQYSNTTSPVQINYSPQSHPGYGCLKNGNLPTYKNYMNKTHKNHSNPQYPNINIINPNTPSSMPKPIIQTPSAYIPTIASNASQQTSSENTNEHLLNQDKLKRISELKQMREIIQKNNKTIPEKLKYMKRKKTLKRTFYVGKSKVHPKIGVLISNKTIRKNILTKSHLLKQTPINEMRKYLIKHGFIKVGSSAPKDVIMKMYESAMLIGGEIRNHNPENLLYNYFHTE